MKTVDMSKYEPYREYMDFIKRYSKAANAATGSEYDANANVSNKHVATMLPEIYKKNNIMTNRLAMHDKLTEMYGPDIADTYVWKQENHIHYSHDSGGMPYNVPYCCSLSLYSFLLKGTKILGGNSGPATNTNAFVGSFINLVFQVAAQFSGAVSTAEFLLYLTRFLCIDYGYDFDKRLDDVVLATTKPRTLRQVIEQYFQQVVYTLNSEAGARGSQSVFWNVAVFDEKYFESLFGTFFFPDGVSAMDVWPQLRIMQKMFMWWLNKERTKHILTFPVLTVSMLNDGKHYLDQDMADFVAQELSEGDSFFIYTSEHADALSGCCRLRSSIESHEFSYTLGAGGLDTGSKRVITINLNRWGQNLMRKKYKDADDVMAEARKPKNFESNLSCIREAMASEIDEVHKYLRAYNELIKEAYDNGMLPVYNSGMLNMTHQFLTTGINGLVCFAQYLGIDINDNPKYKAFVNAILEPIYEADQRDRTDELKWNCEMVPNPSPWAR